MTAALKRLFDWNSRLTAAMEARRFQPYSESDHCGFFLADCVSAMTGVDLAASYRGKAKTIEEGMALLKADGYADMGDFLAKNLEEIHPSRARRGDIMLIDVPGGEVGGVVNGERVTYVGLKGLGTASRMQATRAFRVG